MPPTDLTQPRLYSFKGNNEPEIKRFERTGSNIKRHERNGKFSVSDTDRTDKRLKLHFAPYCRIASPTVGGLEFSRGRTGVSPWEDWAQTTEGFFATRSLEDLTSEISVLSA